MKTGCINRKSSYWKNVNTHIKIIYVLSCLNKLLSFLIYIHLIRWPQRPSFDKSALTSILCVIRLFTADWPARSTLYCALRKCSIYYKNPLIHVSHTRNHHCLNDCYISSAPSLSQCLQPLGVAQQAAGSQLLRPPGVRGGVVPWWSTRGSCSLQYVKWL